MKRKRLIWVGSSKKDLLDFPRGIQKKIGHSLNLAQQEKEDVDTKILRGYGSSVREILKDDIAGTFRAVLTVEYKEAIYVLHVFHKKSKSGIETPKKDREMIRTRLQEAKYLHNTIMKEIQNYEKE